MAFDIKEVVKSKDALRRKLAERPISEKLRMVEDLSERALALRPDTSPSPPDAPWPIPSHWQWKKMADVATVIGGGTPATDHKEYFGGDIPWITPADLSKYTEKTISHGARNITQAGLDNSGARLVPPETVLFSSRAPIGYVAIAANPVATNQGFKSFVLNDQVTPEFVYYYLQRARGLVHSLASGTTFLEISGKKAAQIPVPVPPLDEQQRIVAEIEKQFTRLEAGVAALRRVQANLKRYRAAVLKAACEGRLVPTEAELAKAENRKFENGEELLARILNERRLNWKGRTKYKEPAAPDTAALSPVPKGWTWARLEQLGVTYGGLTKNPKRTKLAKQLPYLRVANVYANELRLDEIEYIGVADSELDKLLVRAGDLLIVEGNGSKDQIGRLAMWDGSIEPCVHQNHLIKVRPVEPRMPKWILHWLQSPSGRQFVEIVASSTSGLFTLSVNKVGNLLIPLPPLAEQTRIVAEVERRLSVIEELETAVIADLQRSIRLRQSILQRAFAG